MANIDTRYRLAQAEFMDACSVHWKAQKLGTFRSILSGVVAAIVGFALLFFIFWLAVFLLAFTGVLFLFIWFRSLFWRWTFRKARRYNSDISLSFGEDGILEETAEGKVDLPWDSYSAYLDAPDFILLYRKRNGFTPIPKSAFSPHQAASLLELLKRKLKKIG